MLSISEMLVLKIDHAILKIDCPDKLLHAKALATIYKAFIRSQLEYCCPIWMGGSMGALNRLDRIQVRAVRIIGHTEQVSLWCFTPESNGQSSKMKMHTLFLFKIDLN